MNYLADSAALKVTARATHFPSLDTESRPFVNTAVAAHWLCRAPQSLRVWACYESGPIKPIRVNGRLAWSVEQIRTLLTGNAA
jgi:hypothetical protein